MNDKYFLKKNFNIPLLNVNQTNIHEHKSGNLGNHPSEKISSSFTAGFKSERIHHKIDPDIIIRQKDARELPEIKKENKDNSGINFFFYKNFNKFIQNLYIEDEQMIKRKINESKKDEKLLPYKKESPAKTTKKSTSGNKRPLTSSSTQKSSSIDKVLKDFKIEAPRRGVSGSNIAETKKNINETNLKRPTTILTGNFATNVSIGDSKEDLVKLYLRESSLRKGNLTINNKIARPISNIDTTKARFEPKDQKDDGKFYSPREFK